MNLRKSLKKMNGFETFKKPPEVETDDEFATPNATSIEFVQGRP